MLRARPSAWTLALLLACLAGCSSFMSEGRVSWKAGAEARPEQLAYQEAIEPFVVEASIYNGMATQLMCSVMPLNPTVRTARVQRIAAARGWDRDRTQRALEAALAEHQERYQVLISVYVPEAKSNNLADKKPQWLVYLAGPDGQRTPPTDRGRISQRTLLNEALYPFWGLWDNLYLFSFPKSTVPKGDKARLFITGAGGQAAVDIQLD